MAPKIYTKTGDKGDTSLFAGGRVSKDTLRLEAYGTVDELNSVIGVVRSLQGDKTVERILIQLQNDLFIAGADLATPLSSNNRIIKRITASYITKLEKTIDRLDASLPTLKAFILPAGSTVTSFFHLARTVCRRGERCIVRLSKQENIGTSLIVYFNRLSDLLFVLARYNTLIVEKGNEVEWKGRLKRRK